MKIDLSEIKEDVFYKWIYPVFARDFLFGAMYYEDFANMVGNRFILSVEQWSEVLDEWEFKERLLTD